MKTQRPPFVQSQCDKAFSKLFDRWAYDGDPSYGLCNVDEFKLLEKMVQTNPEKEVFKILDVGAGDFTFGNTLTNLINNSKIISKDVKFEIYSVRGELNMENLRGESEITGICSHNRIGFFKIENILEQLNEYYDKNASKSYDLITTRWTLRHLVDSVEVLLQLYELLNENGIFLGDGFLYSLGQNEDDNNMLYHENMYRIFNYLEEGGNSVLTYGYSTTRSMDQFMIQREKNAVFEVPYEYQEVISGYRSYDVASDMIVKFKNLDSKNFDHENFKRTDWFCYQGSKQLYELVQKTQSTSRDYESYSGALPKLQCDSQQVSESELVHDVKMVDAYENEYNDDITVDQLGVDSLSNDISLDHI